MIPMIVTIKECGVLKRVIAIRHVMDPISSSSSFLTVDSDGNVVLRNTGVCTVVKLLNKSVFNRSPAEVLEQTGSSKESRQRSGARGVGPPT